MISRKLIANAGAVILAVPIALFAIFRPDRALHVATGFVAHIVCTKTFVSGLDPQTVFAEITDRAGIRRLRSVLGYRLHLAGTTPEAPGGRVFGRPAAVHCAF